MSSEEQEDLSELKKRILARKKVQEEMEDLRGQIRQLRKKQAAGEQVEQDIESNLGYLKVLKKELDSIKEGNHETFLSAKKYISPKLNYGSKKEELLAKIKGLVKEIRAKEKELSGGGFDANQREKLQADLMEIKEKHQHALLELKAIEQYNHTRFLEHKALEETAKKEVEEDLAELPEPKPVEESPIVKQTPDTTLSDFNPPPMI